MTTDWDPNQVRESLVWQAEGAERYVQENLGRIRRSDPRSIAAQTMVDMYSAEADLLNALVAAHL